MKTALIAIALAAAVSARPFPRRHGPGPGRRGAPAAGKMSVKTTKISDIVKNPKAKAALEAALPDITQYYDQIGDMTLAEVAPMSGGAIDDAKLAAIQAEFDKIG